MDGHRHTSDVLEQPLRLGTLPVPGRLFFAPMAGVSDDVFRLLAKYMGCHLTYSEMVSGKGLLMGHKSQMLLHSYPGEGKFVAQLFGREPEVMAQAARYVEAACADRVGMIDINMGCPATKIVRAGEGSALLKDLPQAARVLEAVVGAVRLPVSIKVRKGYAQGDDVSREIVHIAVESGVVALTMHGRTREQAYSGQADWMAVRQAVEVAHGRIAIIGNGDVHSREEAAMRMQQTGCDAVMVGRAAMGNPFLFARAEMSDVQKCAVIQQHIDMEVEKMGERFAVPYLRKWIAAYVHGRPGAAKLRARIFSANSAQQLHEMARMVYGVPASQTDAW